MIIEFDKKYKKAIDDMSADGIFLNFIEEFLWNRIDEKIMEPIGFYTRNLNFYIKVDIKESLFNKRRKRRNISLGKIF